MRGGLRGFRGGFSGGGAAGRDFSQDLYADYSGPDQPAAAAAAAGGGLRMDGYGAGYGGAGGAYGTPAYNAEPSQQIMVRNVSLPINIVFVRDGSTNVFMVAAVVYC